MKSICVFCGSSPGGDPAYASAAAALGTEIASRGLNLVYGGASVGLMGVVADAAIAAGGSVTGVIPQTLIDKEIAHQSLSELIVAGSMHERKALMAERSDAFVALPGGLGTIEEFFEMLTWAQLGLHSKPCGILDVNGFFESLRSFLDHAVAERFLRSENRAMVLTDTDPARLLDQFATYAQPTVEKWIEAYET